MATGRDICNFANQSPMELIFGLDRFFPDDLALASGK